jgi:hypothetical protein
MGELLGSHGGSPSISITKENVVHEDTQEICIVLICPLKLIDGLRLILNTPPPRPRGEAILACGEGLGDQIPTNGQKLWYSMYTIIHLRFLP